MSSPGESTSLRKWVSMSSRLSLSLLLSIFAVAGCHRTQADAPPPTSSAAESRATAMPESLRCNVPADCAPEPSCYWTEPRCVAVASIVAPQCGSDADPPDASRAAVTCGCQAGQCVALSSP